MTSCCHTFNPPFRLPMCNGRFSVFWLSPDRSFTVRYCPEESNSLDTIHFRMDSKFDSRGQPREYLLTYRFNCCLISSARRIARAFKKFSRHCDRDSCSHYRSLRVSNDLLLSLQILPAPPVSLPFFVLNPLR